MGEFRGFEARYHGVTVDMDIKKILVPTDFSSSSEAALVRASSLDDPEVFQPGMIVYASRKPTWDHMDPALPAFAEMPGPADMPEM